MFFDRLFKLTSLKSILLNSTSFSQVYSEERLPLRKLRREGMMLSPLIAGLLAACGGGGGGGGVIIVETTTTVPGTGGGTGGTAAGSFTVFVLDGAVMGATVYVDTNGNGRLDAGEEIGVSDADGAVVVGPEHIGSMISADLTGAFDVYTGEAFTGGQIRGQSPADGGDIVVSPITTLIAELQQAGMTEEQAIAELFGTNALHIDADDLNNPENYVRPLTTSGATVGSSEFIRETVATKSIVLQSLIEQEGGNLAMAAELAAAATRGTGFGVGDLADSTAANARLADALERVQGEPAANPATGLSTDEDVAITLTEEHWGFVDPSGNTLNAAVSEFNSVRIVSIQLVGTTTTDGSPATTLNGVSAGNLLDAAGNAIVGSTIFRQQILDGVQFDPASNVFGTLTITYVVNDGERESDPAELVIEVASVNDAPTDIALTGDRNTTGTGDAVYVLVDGVVQLSDGTVAGVLSATDTETTDQADFTYSVGGQHGPLFTVDATGTLRLADGATPLPAGQTYEISVTVTDSDNEDTDGTYTEEFSILQGGLYISPTNALSDVLARTYSDSDRGILDEEASADAVTAPTAELIIERDILVNGETITIQFVFTAKDAMAPPTGVRFAGDANGFSVDVSGAFDLIFVDEAENDVTLTSLRNDYNGAMAARYTLEYRVLDADGNVDETVTLEDTQRIRIHDGVHVSGEDAIPDSFLIISEVELAPVVESGPDLSTAITIGDLGLDGVPTGSTVTYTLSDDADGQFRLTGADGNILQYIGTESSGDADSTPPASLTVTVASRYTAQIEHTASFTGQTDVDASGDTTDTDDRTFHFSGGDFTTTDTDAVAASTVGLITLTVDDLSTTVSTYQSGNGDREATHFANLIDGVTDSIVWSGGSPTGYHPTDADGETLTITLDDDYTQGEVLIYSRGGGDRTRINDSILRFYLDGEVVEVLDDQGDPIIFELQSSTHVNNLITITPPADLVFDAIEITFSGDDQNLADLQIRGITTTPILEDIPASRTVTVAEGVIYLDDGTFIEFAETTFDITVESTIIVRSDGTVEAVETLPTTDDFYVLGTAQPHTTVTTEAADAVQTVFTLNDETGTLLVTANDVGTARKRYTTSY